MLPTLPDKVGEDGNFGSIQPEQHELIYGTGLMFKNKLSRLLLLVKLNQYYTLHEQSQPQNGGNISAAENHSNSILK